MELASPLSARKLETYFPSRSAVSCVLAKCMDSVEPVQVASCLEHRSIRYGKGAISIASKVTGRRSVERSSRWKHFFPSREYAQTCG